MGRTIVMMCTLALPTDANIMYIFIFARVYYQKKCKNIKIAMQKQYTALQLEKDTQKYWEEKNIFAAAIKKNKNFFYCLAMFPYPSGKLHMGHVRNYTIPDVIARFKRMNNFNVLHPIGWDAFGLPAENAALANKTSPHEWTYQNIAHMRKQLKQLGLSYDWSKELATCDSQYYAWEQWFFIKLYESGLVYKKQSSVNWCEHDQTVLANEQVIDGGCWRCGTTIVKKNLDGWFIKITDYAQDLLDGLDGLQQQWPDSVVQMQKNWIGKSTGTEIIFNLTPHKNLVTDNITVFTTRADTLLGASYIALFPKLFEPTTEAIS